MLSPRSRSHDALVRAVMLRRRLAESKSSSSRASRLASLVVVQAPPTRTRLARQMAPGVALCARWTTLPQRLRARHAQPLECWTLHTHLPGHAILALPHHRQAAPTSPSATTSNVRVDVWMCGCVDVWMCVDVCACGSGRSLLVVSRVTLPRGAPPQEHPLPWSHVAGAHSSSNPPPSRVPCVPCVGTLRRGSTRPRGPAPCARC